MSFVLLIDDAPADRAAVLAAWASAHGCEFRVETSTAAGLRRVAERAPDVVVLGPGCRGVAPAVGRVAPQATVVLLTDSSHFARELDRCWPAVVAEPGDGFDGLRGFVQDRLAAGTTDLWDETRRRVDAVILPLVLAHARGNQQAAAALLGVARQTLRTRLRELGLVPAAPASGTGEPPGG
ncbi:MAG: helix-turn-helix domain-containing protein [Fimbriiglobus sp.]